MKNRKGYLIQEYTILFVVITSASLMFGSIVISKMKSTLESAVSTLEHQLSLSRS